MAPLYIRRSRLPAVLTVLAALPITNISIIAGVVNMKLNEIRIPELEARWRWPRAVSPFLPEVDRESLEWSASFNAFDPETQRLVHDKGKLSTFSVTTSVAHSSTDADIEQTCSPACAMPACPRVGTLLGEIPLGYC